MQWLVIGQGAIGSLMAINLQRTGVKVALKLRQPQPESVTISLDQQTYSFATQSLPLTEPTHIFAAIKAYQVTEFLAELKQSLLPINSTLVLSYNGMLDNEQEVLPAGALHWVTTHGAYRDGAAVIHAGHGESWLGWAQVEQASSRRPAEVFTALNNALPLLNWSPAIHQRRWQKLAMNCLINPFTVIHQCRNGELLHQRVLDEQYALAEELVWLAHHHGVLLQVEDLVQQAQQVIHQTANNYSSMYMDVKHGRPTEIDYLNGFVARQSMQAGHPAPHHQALWHRVRELSLY